MNLVEKKLVIQDKNIIYTMDLDGKIKEVIYDGYWRQSDI
ncbi:MAG: hypothetical protein ACLTMR_12405 [Faecalibacillus sp.]